MNALYWQQFIRWFLLLIYTDYLSLKFLFCRDDLPESAYKYQLLGVNLLRLLAQNKLADFHTVC